MAPQSGSFSPGPTALLTPPPAGSARGSCSAGRGLAHGRERAGSPPPPSRLVAGSLGGEEGAAGGVDVVKGVVVVPCCRALLCAVLFSSTMCLAAPRSVLGWSAVLLCFAGCGALCCISLCCVLLCVVCGAQLCCAGVPASCRSMRCSAASFALVGAVCCCLSFLGVRWRVGLLPVVSWWCLSAFVSLSGCMAGRSVVWRGLPCCPPLPCCVMCCRASVSGCAAVLFCLFCCAAFLLLFLTTCRAAVLFCCCCGLFLFFLTTLEYYYKNKIFLCVQNKIKLNTTRHATHARAARPWVRLNSRVAGRLRWSVVGVGAVVGVVDVVVR